MTIESCRLRNRAVAARKVYAFPVCTVRMPRACSYVAAASSATNVACSRTDCRLHSRTVPSLASPRQRPPAPPQLALDPSHTDTRSAAAVLNPAKKVFIKFYACKFSTKNCNFKNTPLSLL